MGIRSKVTIHDIAKKASVSIATVSRIINNKDTVAKETRDRVLDVMNSLNYKPVFSPPQSEIQNNVILVCVSDLSNPFNSPVIDGIQQAAQPHKYHVLLIQKKDFYHNYDDFRNILEKQHPAGIILLTSASDHNLVEDMKTHCPVVMCSEYFEGKDISFVSIDDIAAARKATEYLISTGCSRIAMLNGSLIHKYSRNREQGYREALESAGLKVNSEWISHVPNINYNLAMSHALYILDTEPRVDAFFAASDVYAIAILRAAKKLKLRVPEDISVIGFDNIELSAMTDPPITTVEQPSYQIGFQCCALLLEKITVPFSKPKQIILDTELIIRETTLRQSQ
jgi:DNA-binding LacI/PurR family transcriptional regulator